MALNQKKYEHKHEAILRDVRPLSTRIADGLSSRDYSSLLFATAAMSVYYNEWALTFADMIVVVMVLYFIWLTTRSKELAFKLPLGSKYLDPNNGRGGKKGKAEGILYLGNVDKTNEEVWFTNSDIRTHILYLGTTGAGKTEGLKSLVTNAMCWGSGFVYVDGKADTDLWSSLSSLVRRFGRDDDLLVLNYMTGNADVQAPSNTMNPFSSGSASYLTNMLVSLMPESGGDNAMWKERAVSLVGALMPILTWKRDNQEVPMSVRTIREYLSLNNIIKLARDDVVPETTREGLKGYLDTLPGFIADAYDDNGNVKPPGPDTPQYNTETASQQHGFLAMQFTRSLQSLGDDYGYIFDTQAADVDMVDVVLNRRILVVLVPALEKSGDEVANLGKIVAASIKGMMGSALGSTVEGSSETVIENKPTHSSTPFMTVFDEVGYYVAEGMAVMAAQARSLGFSLGFAGQDLPAMKKRVREEANSITANCNIKLFGKLEDPTETKDFFEKTVGSAMVTEVSGFQMSGGSEMGSYHDTKQAGVQLRPRASYDTLRGFKEGQAVITYGETVVDCAVFYSNPGFAKAMRVTRFMSLPPPDDTLLKHAGAITKLRDLMVNKSWTAMRADVAVETDDAINAMYEGFTKNNREGVDPVEAGIAAIVQIHAIDNEIPAPTEAASSGGSTGGGGGSGGGGSAPRKPPGSPVGQVAAKKQAPAQGAASSPLAAKRPAETAAAGVTVASTSAAAPSTPAKQESGSAKPSVFGGGTPKKETPAAAAPPAQESQASAPAEKPASAKPSVFGAKPDAPKAEAPAQPPAAPKQEDGAASKPAIFGTPKKETPAAAAPPAQETPVSPAPTEKSDNAKPAIFGAKPDAPKAEAPAQPPTAPKQEDGAASKPAIFGTPKTEEPPAAPPAQESPASVPAEKSDNAKPAIFGAKPDAPKAEAPAQPPAAPKQQDDGSATKPAIFGTPKSEEPPATPPAQPPQEQNEDKPAKPAIFGSKPKDENDENKE